MKNLCDPGQLLISWYLRQGLMYRFQVGMWSNVMLEISNMYRLGMYVADPPFSLFAGTRKQAAFQVLWACAFRTLHLPGMNI